MDPKGNLKKFRSVWMIGLSIEKPVMGDVFASLLTGDIVGAVLSFIPHIGIMFLPIKKDFGHCIDTVASTNEARALTYSQPHQGACQVVMKHLLLSDMLQQMWLSVSPTFY
jgi:hypothetical protein